MAPWHFVHLANQTKEKVLSMEQPPNVSLLSIGSSASATGNPRNKCALKPGFSLMGWIRLCNSGVDLAGTNGQIISVTTTELSKHNKRDNAWMAITGKVYNVTRYMDYHPGGEKELMRGVGRDATVLFNEVHAWVNYQQLLAKCYIGPLVININESLLSMNDDASNHQSSLSRNSITDELSLLKLPSDGCIEIVPRFDWVQKRDELTIYIYTRTNCNPGLLVRRLNNKNLQMHVQIKETVYLLSVELQQIVQWPPRLIKIATAESSKIEVTLTKAMPHELWTSYGIHTFTKYKSTQLDLKIELIDYKIVEKKEFNHDSFLMRLQSEDTLMYLPIGYYLSICALINGKYVERSYTPVPAKFMPYTKTSDLISPLDLNFLIKNYSNGQVSSYLKKLEIGDIIKFSIPRGSLELDKLLPHRRFVFLAAGSGLTPFLSVMEHLLQRYTNRIKRLQLYYFNKTSVDIWCKGALEALQMDDERFNFTNVLSQPDCSWTGLKGYLSKDILSPLLEKHHDQHDTYIFACGPIGFNQLCNELLLQTFQFNTENYHIF